MSYVCEKSVGPEKTCDFRSGREILQQPIEPEQMSKLLAEGRTDLLTGFVSSRTRRKFKAFLVKQPDGKISFEFDNSKARLAKAGGAPTSGGAVEAGAAAGDPGLAHAAARPAGGKTGRLRLAAASKAASPAVKPRKTAVAKRAAAPATKKGPGKKRRGLQQSGLLQAGLRKRVRATPKPSVPKPSVPKPSVPRPWVARSAAARLPPPRPRGPPWFPGGRA
jgi:DNA topoisomerase-3